MSEGYTPESLFFGQKPEQYNINQETYPLGYDMIYHSRKVIAGGTEFYIPGPSEVLYSLGRGNLENQPNFTVFGSRKSNPECEEFAFQLGKALGENEFGTLSGLANGTDRFAHEGALAGGGYTGAFLPTSFYNIVPKSNLGLAEQIINNNGAVFTRYSAKDSYPNYKDRNMDMVVASKGVFLIHGGNPMKYPNDPTRSGSRLTARLAYFTGRPIGVFIPEKKENIGTLNAALLKQRDTVIREKGHSLIVPIRNIKDAIAFANKYAT